MVPLPFATHAFIALKMLPFKVPSSSVLSPEKDLIVVNNAPLDLIVSIEICEVSDGEGAVKFHVYDRVGVHGSTIPQWSILEKNVWVSQWRRSHKLTSSEPRLGRRVMPAWNSLAVVVY